MDELLDLVQQRFSPPVVELDSLPLKQRVDVGIVAVGKSPALDDESLEPGRGVAEGASGAHDQVVVFPSGVAFYEPGSLDRSQRCYEPVFTSMHEPSADFLGNLNGLNGMESLLPHIVLLGSMECRFTLVGIVRAQNAWGRVVNPWADGPEETAMRTVLGLLWLRR